MAGSHFEEQCTLIRSRFRRDVLRWLASLESRSERPSIVLAVSGGGDSIGLLRLFDEFSALHGLVASVAHFVHEEDAADLEALEFVKHASADLGIPCDSTVWPSEHRSRSESAARDARLSWLVETAKIRNASAVALGHTSDDQVETLLHRVLRGTGLRGLEGIPRIREMGGVVLYRPLLTTSRADLRGYLDAIGQVYLEDPSNEDVGRTRSRIRNVLLPLLERDFNPRVREALSRLAFHAKANRCIAEVYVQQAVEAATIRSTAAEVELDRARLASEPLAVRLEILRTAWRAAGWGERSMSTKRWLRLGRWCKRPHASRFAVGAGVDAALTPETIVMFKNPSG